MRRLLEIAGERGLFVEWSRDMGERLRAVYEHEARTITLNAWMSAEQQRFALAHELGHAWHGHTYTGRIHLDAEAERLADEHAASLLIDPGAYARAERLRGPHPAAIADELAVHPDVVVIFQRMLGRSAPAARRRPWGGAGWLQSHQDLTA